MNVESMLENIVKKSGIEVEKIKASYATELAKVPEGTKNREMVALKAVNKEYAVGKSPAVGYSGVIIGMGNFIDYTKKRLQAATEAYQSNPQSAIENGLVKVDNDKVIALDNRKAFANGKPNNNFGKPLASSTARNCLAFIVDDKGAYNMATLSLRNQHAKNVPVMNTLLKFRALGSVQDGLRTSDTATQFETSDLISSEVLNDLIVKHGGDHMKVLGDCMDYHNSIPDKTREYYDRYVITSGNVVLAKEAAEGKNSHFVLLDDPSVTDSVSCFVPLQVQLPAQGSEITVIAQTNIGKKWDSETKSQTDEDVLQLNVMGIISS